MLDPPHAAQILTKHEDGQYVLNEEVLEMVLTQPEVAETPIALYSVAGPFRKGKSFILNLFLQFLWNGRNEKWKNDLEKLLDKGFPWRGGRERDTQGILIWTEPFVVNINGKQVAILLMDTQGTFDLSTSMQGNSLVFALSTLISSMQIYNLSQIVSNNDLQALQLFTEFGKLAQEENDDITAFQFLFFLIRDWSDDDVNVGLESGRKYLKEVVLSSGKEKEIGNITNSTKTSFENKECFLMPEPNKAIRNRGKTKGPCKLSEIGKEFLDEVQVLMDYIFYDPNIPIKKVNGKEVTGVDLLNYTISYMNQLTKDIIPEAEHLFQATIAAYWLNAMRQSLRTYKQEMGKIRKQRKHMPDAELIKQSNKIKQDVMVLFHKRRKMGGENASQKYKIKLERRLNKEFSMFRNTNIQYEISHIFECKEFIADLMTSLKILLEQKTSEVDFLEDESLKEIFRKFKTRTKDDCIKKFNSGTSDPNLVKQCEDELSTSLNRVYHIHKELNGKSKDKYQTRLRCQADVAKQRYIEEVNYKTNGKYVDKEKLSTILENALKSALSAFDSNLSVDQPNPQIATDIRNHLQNDLLNEQNNFYDNNEKYKILSFQAVGASKITYMNELKQKLGKGQQSLKLLKECHDNSLRNARFGLQKMLLHCDETTKLECQQTLEQDAGQYFKSYERTLKELDVETCSKYKMEALKLYKDQMRVTAVMTRDESIKKLHQRCLEESQESLRKKILENNGSTDKWLQELREEISIDYTGILKAREDERKRKEEAQQVAIKEAVITYLKDMKQITEGMYVRPASLLREHERLKGQIFDRWHSSTGLQPPDELNVSLEKAFREMEEENKEGKDIWMRTQTKQKEIKVSEGLFAKLMKFFKR